MGPGMCRDCIPIPLDHSLKIFCVFFFLFNNNAFSEKGKKAPRWKEKESIRVGHSLTPATTRPSSPTLPTLLTWPCSTLHGICPSTRAHRSAQRLGPPLPPTRCWSIPFSANDHLHLRLFVSAETFLCLPSPPSTPSQSANTQRSDT